MSDPTIPRLRDASPEERHAWDLYAAALVTADEVTADHAAIMADELLTLRRERFGSRW